MTDPWASFALQQLAGRQPEAKRPHYQPHPAGIFQTGSATAAVHDFLAAHPGRFFSLDQLILATGKTNKACDWAVRFLISIGRVEWRSDEFRNERYRRYAAPAAAS
jgi:hypothetical protein